MGCLSEFTYSQFESSKLIAAHSKLSPDLYFQSSISSTGYSSNEETENGCVTPLYWLTYKIKRSAVTNDSLILICFLYTIIKNNHHSI
ncbi:MAG: hypothetical protein D8M61_10555 [Ignavibacteriae bacterium]|nr:hypothetical protein [Ignavibacteriota bacterium]